MFKKLAKIYQTVSYFRMTISLYKALTKYLVHFISELLLSILSTMIFHCSVAILHKKKKIPWQHHIERIRQIAKNNRLTNIKNVKK